MDLEAIFFDYERTIRQVEYLTYNLENLDAELFSSFNINPLREKSLDISSMFYANICLRLYPLLTIAFQVHTFQNVQKRNFEHYIKTQKDSEYWEGVNLNDILEKIKILRDLNRENKDNIRDYYKSYRKIDNRIWIYFNMNEKLRPINYVGLIEYEKDIEPFKKEDWNKFLDVRNSIEHRGVIEAKLSNVILGYGGLYLLCKGLCYSYGGASYSFKSKIFGDVGYQSNL